MEKYPGTSARSGASRRRGWTGGFVGAREGERPAHCPSKEAVQQPYIENDRASLAAMIWGLGSQPPPAPGAERVASGLLFNDYALALAGLCECHFTTGRQSRLKNCFPISQLIEPFQLRQHSPCSSTWTGTDELTPLCQRVPPLGLHYCDKQFFIISLFRIIFV